MAVIRRKSQNFMTTSFGYLVNLKHRSLRFVLRNQFKQFSFSHISLYSVGNKLTFPVGASGGFINFSTTIKSVLSVTIILFWFYVSKKLFYKPQNKSLVIQLFLPILCYFRLKKQKSSFHQSVDRTCIAIINLPPRPKGIGLLQSRDSQSMILNLKNFCLPTSFSLSVQYCSIRLPLRFEENHFSEQTISLLSSNI